MSNVKLPRKTMNERRPDSIRTEYGRVGFQPVALRIPVKVTQVRRIDDVKRLPQFQAHAYQVDGAWSAAIHEIEDLTDARPAGFEPLTREQYHELRGERERARAQVKAAIAGARKRRTA